MPSLDTKHVGPVPSLLFSSVRVFRGIRGTQLLQADIRVALRMSRPRSAVLPDVKGTLCLACPYSYCLRWGWFPGRPFHLLCCPSISFTSTPSLLICSGPLFLSLPLVLVFREFVSGFSGYTCIDAHDLTCGSRSA